MKIRRVKVRTEKGTGKEHFRPMVALPIELLKELGWDYGTELRAERVSAGVLLELADDE